MTVGRRLVSYNKMARRKAKKDDNHAQVVNALRRVGAAVFDTASTPCGFDLVVAFRGVVHIVEVKDGEKLPAKFETMNEQERREYLEGMLTDNERDAMERTEATGGQYNIIHNVRAALDMIGAGWGKKT